MGEFWNCKAFESGVEQQLFDLQSNPIHTIQADGSKDSPSLEEEDQVFSSFDYNPRHSAGFAYAICQRGSTEMKGDFSPV